MTDIVDEIKGHDDMVGANMGYRMFSTDEEKPESTDEEPVEEVENDEEVSDDDDGESDDDADEDEDKSDDSELPKVSGELEEERKNLQRVFNDRMQEVSGLRMKAQLADAIAENPEAVIKNLAAQYNINMSPKEVKESKKELDLEGLKPGEKESLPSFIARVMGQVLDAREVNEPKVAPKQTGPSVREEVEKTLTHIKTKYSDWGIYEKRMSELVMKHPSLYRDPDELYRLAKGSHNDPKDKAKSKKAKGKTKKVSSGERGRAPVITTQKGKKVPFNVAWDRAMAAANK